VVLDDNYIPGQGAAAPPPAVATTTALRSWEIVIIAMGATFLWYLCTQRILVLAAPRLSHCIPDKKESGSESVRPTLAASRLSSFQLRSCARAAPNRAPYLQGSSLASWYGSVTAVASQYRWMHGPPSPVTRRLSRSQAPRLLVLQCSLGFEGPHLTPHCVSSTGLSAQLAACHHPPRPRRLTSQPTRRSLRTGRLATGRHFVAKNRLRLHGTS
jgi:hypothetical protein